MSCLKTDPKQRARSIQTTDGLRAARQTSVQQRRSLREPLLESCSTYLPVLRLSAAYSRGVIARNASAKSQRFKADSRLRHQYVTFNLRTICLYVSIAATSSALEILSPGVCASSIDPGPNNSGLPQFVRAGMSVVNATTAVHNPSIFSLNTGSHSKHQLCFSFRWNDVSRDSSFDHSDVHRGCAKRFVGRPLGPLKIGKHFQQLINCRLALLWVSRMSRSPA